MTKPITCSNIIDITTQQINGLTDPMLETLIKCAQDKYNQTQNHNYLLIKQKLNEELHSRGLKFGKSGKFKSGKVTLRVLKSHLKYCR